METSQPLPAVPPSGGLLQQIGLFLGGLVLPLGSLTFYRKVSQQRVAVALLFFLLFTTGISFLITLNVGKDLWPVQGEIQKAFDQGKFPEITIRNGLAQVKGDQTQVLIDQDTMFVAIDMTGQYTGIDRTKYTQGFLLTQDTLVFLSQNGQYRSLPLSQFNEVFNQDPIVINAQTTVQFWQAFTLITVIVVFLALLVWSTLLRLMYVAMLALIIWAVISLFRPKAGFGPVIISGLYALVPAIYLTYLFDLAKLSFPGLQTLLLLPFWVIGLMASFSGADFFRERSLRLWRAVIGLPLLLLLMVDIFVPYQYEAGIAWALAVLTFLALLGVGLVTRGSGPAPAPVEPTPVEPTPLP